MKTSMKKALVVLAYGDVDPFRRTFQDAYGYIGAQIRGMVDGSALGPGEIKSNTGVMAQAYELGKMLL